MFFFPYGPTILPKANNGLIDNTRDSLAKFWSEVEEEVEGGLADAVGCYIFSIRAGRGILPWYVGLAEKQSFKQECFTAHKINHYNNAIAKRKGTPLLTFIAKYTETDRFAKPSINGHPDIQFLEDALIYNCIRKNAALMNFANTKFLREMVVHGFLNNPPGRDCDSVTSFRCLLGL